MNWPVFSFFDPVVQDFGFGLIEVVAPILAFFAALGIAVFAVQRLRSGLASRVAFNEGFEQGYLNVHREAGREVGSLEALASVNGYYEDYGYSFEEEV